MQSAPIVFSILHTNDMHSNFLGLGPVIDYTPERSNPEDHTVGGYARTGHAASGAGACRNGPCFVLVLDAGADTMGTALGAACRQTGAELRMMAQLGYDATTFWTSRQLHFGLVRAGADDRAPCGGPGSGAAIVIANAGLQPRARSWRSCAG